MSKRIYLGRSKNHGASIVFRSASIPTAETHGHLYGAVIGPFRTVRAARFMARHGQNNPHLQCVADAERIAKMEQLD